MFPGKYLCKPCLPTVPGEEGVGDVVEVGCRVGTLKRRDRVVVTSRMLGTWRYYGIYDERDVHVVSPNLPLAEAATLTLAPCMAYRMLKDYINLPPGSAVIQNAANSPCGQAVIQLCKAWGIKTFNIVANHCGYECVKAHLLSLGATAVHTLEEAEQLSGFNTSLTRPLLGLNCLGGRYEDTMLKLLERNGTIVYYGCAYDLPLVKQFVRCDARFYRFDLNHWNDEASSVDKDVMLTELVQLMVVKCLKAPMHQPIELKDYVHAFKNTVHCEAFSILSFVFDLSLP